jgi:hypothetical protein
VPVQHETLEQSIYNRALKHKARKEERLVFREIAVLGLLHFWKLDQAEKFESQRNNGDALTPEKMLEIQNSFTEGMADQWYRQATDELKEIKPTFTYGVIQGVVSSFVWSIIVLVMGFIFISTFDPALSSRIYHAFFPATDTVIQNFSLDIVGSNKMGHP